MILLTLGSPWEVKGNANKRKILKNIIHTLPCCNNFADKYAFMCILAERPGVAYGKKILNKKIISSFLAYNTPWTPMSVHKKFQLNESSCLAGYMQHTYIYTNILFYIYVYGNFMHGLDPAIDLMKTKKDKLCILNSIREDCWYLQFYLKSLPPSLLKKTIFFKWFLEKVNEFLFSEMEKNSQS